MSQEAFDELDAEVAARNRARAESVGKQFEAQGYRTVHEALYALLPPATQEACLAELMGNSDTAGRRMPLTVNRAKSGSEPPDPSLDLVANLNDVCDFFRGRAAELDVERSDGS
ncbi:MAG: hypothetical protein KC492_05105, partial [Myxococcales bacterium]|nr:hypothetical protein [Myxococcales bacterium]